MMFDTRASIFPVLRHDFVTDKPIAVDAWRDGEYLGTGFFVDTSSPTVAFVTAGHVVDVPLRPHQRIGIGSIETNGIYWWDYFERHRTADLAVAYIERKSLPEWIKPLKLFPPDQTLHLGTEVVVFGFPLTEKRQTVDGKKEFRIVETCFRGYIAAIYDKDNLDRMDGAFSVNYALSFESPSGLSGAPLLLHRGDKVLVGGLTYKNKSTYFLIDQETTTDKEGKIEKEISYRVYHSALAGGLKELADDRDFARSTQPITESHG
jgi:hypothetical protein